MELNASRWSLLRLVVKDQVIARPGGKAQVKSIAAKLNLSAFFLYCAAGSLLVAAPFVFFGAHVKLPVSLRNVSLNCGAVHLNLTPVLLVFSIAAVVLLIPWARRLPKNRNPCSDVSKRTSGQRHSLFGHRRGIFEMKDLIAYGRLLDVARVAGAILAGVVVLQLISPTISGFAPEEKLGAKIEQAGQCVETLIYAQRLEGGLTYPERSYAIVPACPLSHKHLEHARTLVKIPDGPDACARSHGEWALSLLVALIPFVVYMGAALLLALLAAVVATNRIRRAGNPEKSPALSEMNAWFESTLDVKRLAKISRDLSKKTQSGKHENWPFATYEDLIRWGVISLTLFPDPEQIETTSAGTTTTAMRSRHLIQGFLPNFQWSFVVVALSPIIVPFVALLVTTMVLWQMPAQVFGMPGTVFVAEVHKPVIGFSVLCWAAWSNYFFVRVAESLAVVGVLGGNDEQQTALPLDGYWIVDPTKRAFSPRLGHVLRVPLEIRRSLMPVPYRSHILKSIDGVTGDSCRKQLVVISTVIAAVFLSVIGAY